MRVRRARPGGRRAERGRDGVLAVDRARPLEAPPEAGERRYQRELRSMMYGFGDAQEVDAESVEMVERLVRQYIDELLGEASAIASIRRCPLDSGCLLYAVRHDRLKFERARRLLEMKEVIRDARKKTEEVDDID